MFLLIIQILFGKLLFYLETTPFPKFVAIKRMNPGQKNDGVTLATIREIMILREFKHKNVISILDIFVRDNYIYMVMPFMVGDLEILIRAKNKILLTPSHIKTYMFQIISAVNYCHKKYKNLNII